MNPILKKTLLIAAFVLATLVAPMLFLLIFFDSSTHFSAYVIVYGLIIFSILGYVIISVRNMEKKLEDTMEEIKMQNAAIAHKLTNNENTFNAHAVQQGTPSKAVNEGTIKNNSANIPLNPAEPLVMPEKKIADDTFNDFK